MVLDLVEPYFGSWKGVTVDNIYSSVALAEELFKLCVAKTGKICCNKWEISQEFLPHSKREE
jgi:hypothetical protein